METGQPPAPKRASKSRSTRAAERASSDCAKQKQSLLVKCAGSLKDCIVIENFATGGVDCAKAELTVSSIYCGSGTLERKHIRTATLFAKYLRFKW